MTFPKKVKFVRRKLYLSQVALAKEIGVAFQTINRWENGHGEPNLVLEAKFDDFCKKIENYISKDVNYQMKQQVASKLFTIPPYSLQYSQGKMYSLLLSDSAVCIYLIHCRQGF